jgi:alpha-tubulin suppressor-like RCC1 family protein
LKVDGTVWSCGNNISGQLGDNTTIAKTTAGPVGLIGATAIVGGGDHSLFLKNDSTVWACGDNFNGQFGNGTNTSKNTPVKIFPCCNLADIPTLTASINTSCSGNQP